MTAQLSSASTETVQVGVLAYAEGAPIDPSGYTVQFGFVPTSVLTVPTEWTSGAWDVTGDGQHVAQCLVGPGSDQALATGTYFVWVQITAGDETIIRDVGELEVS